MAYDSTFTPSGATVLVGVAAVQCPPIAPNQVQSTSYRIRCLVTGYLAWSPQVSSGVAPTGMAATAPTAGVPSATTIGMSAGQVETFGLPQYAWFLSNNAAGFEVTPGEGL